METKVIGILQKNELSDFFSQMDNLLMIDRIVNDKWHKMLKNELEYHDFYLNYCEDGKIEHILEDVFLS